jgi:hypothetical protein
LSPKIVTQRPKRRIELGLLKVALTLRFGLWNLPTLAIHVVDSLIHRCCKAECEGRAYREKQVSMKREGRRLKIVPAMEPVHMIHFGARHTPTVN